MNINLTYLIISLICNLLIFSDAVLASRQQDQTWLQQSSEHFTVIYPSHVSRTAKQILAIAEDNFAGVAATAGYQPKGLIPLVLNHDTDYANAFAQSVFKKIEINLTPSDSPEFGGDNISWWEDLFLHEYVHLCHGMNDEQGISWLLSTLFGEVNGLNFIAPRWWVEGIGVYSESSQTDGGRGESSYFQMQLAGNLLSDQPWTRAQVSHSPKFSRPWGRIYYLGYDLIKQASLTEPQIIKKVSREQSNWPFWGLGAVWRHVLNQSLDKHWQATLNLKTREFKERYQNKGTPIKGGYYLTNVKDNDYQSPQWIDHQRLIVLEDNIDFGKNIVEININSKQKKIWKADIELKGYMEWSPYNKCLYYATLEVDPFHGNHFRAKLWSAGEQGRTEPMMDKMRCWSPTLSKQHQLAVIKNDQGEARLMVGKVGQKIEDQWLTPPGSSYKTPRFSPNGESLAVVASQHEQQDICLIDIKSNSLTAILGWDQAFDLDPTWSPDGKWLYFISDRSGGVFQLYVWSIETAALYKISHAQFGVFQPAVSPDGQQICLVEFQANHQEQLFVAPLDPSTWEKIEHPKQMVGWPKTKQVKELASTKGTDEETYNAWSYIWPTFWIPAFGFNQQGLLMGIFSAQRDPLEFHEWQGSLLYSLKSGWPYGYLTYSNQYWPITWSMTIAREATNQLIVIQDEVETVDWGIREAVNFKAQTTIWHHRSRDWSTTSSAGLTIGWNTYRSEVTTLLPQVLYVQPVLSFGHGFSGPKDFFTIKGWSAKFGGKFSLNHEWSTGQAVSGSGSLYWPGLADHHGWRLSLRGGHQLGDFPENNGQYVPYGYQQDMNALDYQSTATLSYRFPIGYIDQGWAEWPVFLNDLWLALTYEQGLSWNKEWPWSEISNHSTSSLSLEGTLDVTLFWYLTGAVNSKLIYRLSQQDFVGELDLGVRF